MKRLLAYLFIVLGLGLAVNGNTETKASSSSNLKKYCYVIHFNDSKLKTPRTFYISENLKNCKNESKYKKPKYNIKKYTYRDVDEFIYILLSTKKNKNSVAAHNNLNYIYSLFSVKTISTSIVDRVVMDNKEKLSSYVPHLKSTQIAKAEPSQTQKGLDLLKQQVEWIVWVKHVDKDYRKQRPYTGESDHIIYDIDNGVYIINPKNSKDEAILMAKEKCWKDYPNSKSGCLIDKINRLESQGPGKGVSWNAPSESTFYWKEELSKYNSKNKTQITKVEPSQTQEVAKGKNLCLIDWPSNIDYGNYQGLNIPVDKVVFIKRLKYDDGSSCHLKIFASDNEKLYKKIIWSAFQDRKLYEVDGKKMSLRWLPYKTLLKIHKDQNLKMVKFNISKPKTKIAKAEPSQTQKVVKKEVTEKDKYSFCITKNEWKVPLISLNCNLGNNKKVSLDEFVNSYLHEMDKNIVGPYRQTRFDLVLEKLLFQFKLYKLDTNLLLTSIKTNRNINILYKNSKLQIAKVEPTVKPKKKIKVAKVEEPKQEEFKPKKTNQDNEAPVIEIAETITVNDSIYEFTGKVTDKAKTIYVEVDGRSVDVKKGQFVVKGYSPIDKQISITAFDQWGNRSEPKIVKLTIDIKDTNVAEKLEPLNPSKIRSKSSNNKIALIIGIENYSEAPKANYANLDAKYFFDYARKAFGVKKQNINLLVNEEATVVKTDKALSLWLKSKIKKDKSELIIFFAGHGLASTDGKELYLLPQDGNPDRLERTAISRTDLFKEIISLSPKSVTMFLDTCYSGVSRDEQMLLASARPIRIVADEQEGIPDNFTIFSASQLDQISSGFKEAKHGIFSYYLMKGLEGKADANKDKDITNGELLAYMDQNVAQKASELGRQQNPSLAGDPDKILMSYR